MSRPTPQSTTAGRVLIADDDAEMRRVLMDVLALDGHDVYDVADGASLLIELASNNRFNFRAVDVVVADVRMPLCTGIDALEAVRGVPLELPFVLLSAFADVELHETAKRLGAVLLDKPVPLRRLRQIVVAQIRRARALRANLSRWSNH